MALVSLEHLSAGIRSWRARPRWPSDFHNGFYRQLQETLQSGMDETCWGRLVGWLSGWRAIRPLSKEEVFARGRGRLYHLSSAFQAAKAAMGQAPNLATASWGDAWPLFRVAHGIKSVDSPVFGSKLCHFLFPNVFPVIDRDAVGLGWSTYEEYWRHCRREWTECEQKLSLVETLRQEIGPAVMPSYPFETKITELCLIGSPPVARRSTRFRVDRV